MVDAVGYPRVTLATPQVFASLDAPLPTDPAADRTSAPSEAAPAKEPKTTARVAERPSPAALAARETQPSLEEAGEIPDDVSKARARTAPLEADVVAAPASQSLPAPVRRGLFSTSPPGYREGDFIAAYRAGDRWIVVEPEPETVPTTWQHRVILWFALSLALVTPLGWLFARRITAPLRSFADAAEKLGRDPSAEVVVQAGSGEVARAAAAFDQMQARLKRYVEDRTAMIGAISHDLRTPLTRMRFRLESAPDNLKRGFQTDIDQMEAMVASVLAFMRDQAESAARRRLDIRALLEDAVDNAVAGGANVAIEPGPGADVHADALALSRVFTNLLDNAVKYGERAVVQVKRQDKDVVVCVRDFGPGLPETELERVFKPFYRTPNAIASKASGLGLGLANSRAIVLAHGGAITMTSHDGLTVEVRLPIAA